MQFVNILYNASEKLVALTSQGNVATLYRWCGNI